MTHLSFDVWNTLISPNPEFAERRDAFFASYLNVSENDARRRYRRVKDASDEQAEHNGVGYTSGEIYHQLLPEHTVAERRTVRMALETLFYLSPPTVGTGVPETLQRLQKLGIGLSVASNTNFIRGRCLDEVVLSKLGVDWDFQVFSDEIGCAKPHGDFFRNVRRQASDKVRHFGDHDICDGGCTNYGLEFTKVRHPDELKWVLLDVK